MTSPQVLPLPPFKVLSASTAGGTMRAYVQPLDPSDPHAEITRVSLGGEAPSTRAGGFTNLNVGGTAAVSLGVAWVWIIGNRPVVKTRRVVGGADGTTFFVRSTATMDQFYFVGPPGSRVTITPFPAVPGRVPVVIDAVNPYAECTSSAIVLRGLVASSQADAELLALVAHARQSAASAGVSEH
jgi:hypothetical protein